MNRRTLLAGAGAGLSIGLCGCLEEGQIGDGGNGADNDETDGGDGEADNNGTDGGADSDDETETITEDPRIDSPPYPIDPPETPEDPGDEEAWNEEYLGENMPTEPSLRIDQFSIPAGAIRDSSLREALGSGEDGYVAELVTEEADIEDVFDTESIDDGEEERLRAVDFDEAAVVAVESGFGSGSVQHRWGRAEGDGATLRLHGYYTEPFIRTDDITTRASVLEVERPASGLDYARVSLTVGEDRRVHFNSTEGVVTVDR